MATTTVADHQPDDLFAPAGEELDRIIALADALPRDREDPGWSDIEVARSLGDTSPTIAAPPQDDPPALRRGDRRDTPQADPAGRVPPRLRLGKAVPMVGTEEARGRPQDLQAETDLLCACLQESRWADLALQSVEVGDFADEGHQVVFAAVKRLREAGAEADAGSVVSELHRVNAPAEVLTYAEALPAQWVPLGRQVEQRLAVIRRQSALRQIINTAGDLRDRAFTNPDDPAAMIDSAITELQASRGAWQPTRVEPPISFADADVLLGEASWAWPGWLADGALHILCAPPAGGKSFVGLDLMRCFATGADWPDGAQNEREAGNCLLVDYEATGREYIERARAAGMPLKRLFFQPTGALPYLTDGSSFDFLRKCIEDINARFVVLDSWRDGAPGVNEDASGEVAPTLQPLRVIATEFNIPVLLHHHPGKVFGGNWIMQPGSLRGSGVFLSEPRLVLAIDKPNGNAENRVLKAMKRNAGPQPAPIGFTITDAGLDWGEATKRTRARPKMDSAKCHVLDAIRRGSLAFSTITEFCMNAGDKERTVADAIAELEASAAITKANDGTYGLAVLDDR